MKYQYAYITSFFVIFGMGFMNYSQSQNIRVLFNQSVDNSVSSITDAVQAINIEDTICKYIDMANSSIDIAVWDNGSTKIISALNSAYNRGVVVRYISSSNSLNTALSNINSGISVLERDASVSTNVMHNKFVLIDDTFMLTGSMNFGNGSMFDDYNNLVFIFDNTITQAYKTEFDEMWGGIDTQPNITNSKFGPDKTDNTLHNFTIGGSPVELYFSPTDGTTSKIVEAINSANYTLDIAMFTFINNDIGDAVVTAKNRGVVVRAIIENINYIGSEYSSLLSNGINVLSHSNVPYDFHHKYCIIDANNSNSDPIVITGSHNWTNSAEEDNDENTLIIHNHIVANQYLEEFSKRFSELSTLSVENQQSLNQMVLFPNPTKEMIEFLSPVLLTKARIIIKNVEGKTILINNNVNGFKHTIDVSSLSKGVYFLYIIQNGEIGHLKLIKE